MYTGYRVRVTNTPDEEIPEEYFDINDWVYPEGMTERLVLIDQEYLYFSFPEPISKELALDISQVMEEDLIKLLKR